MIGIKKLNSTLIIKSGASLYEGDPMLFYVRCFFSFIPLELKLFHMYIVLIIMKMARCVYGAERPLGRNGMDSFPSTRHRNVPD